MYDQSNETFLLTRYQLYCSYYETLTHNDNGSSVESDKHFENHSLHTCRYRVFVPSVTLHKIPRAGMCIKFYSQLTTVGEVLLNQSKSVQELDLEPF